MNTRVLRLTVGLIFVLFGAPVQAADCNGNGVEDEEDIAQAASVDCNANGVPDACEVAPLPLQEFASILLPGRVRDAVFADFNGDEQLDFALGYQSGITVYLALSSREAGGDLTSDYEVTDYPLEVTTLSWRTGDFNGDSKPDLLTLESSGVILFLGRGDGSFEEPVTNTAFEGVASLHAVDLNADGFHDIVMPDTADKAVSVAMNLTDGSFAPRLDYTVGGFPGALAFADLNGDDAIDVAVGDQSSGGVAVVLNGGDGTLTPLAEPLDSGGRRVRDLAMADMNGDDLLDVVVSTRSAVAWFPNLGVGEAGTVEFGPVRSFVPGGLLGALGVGDLDADGDTDVMVSSSGNVLALINGGGGHLTTSLVLLAQLAAHSLHLRDLDGDGDPDVLAPLQGKSDVGVLWNSGGGLANQLVFAEPKIFNSGGDAHALDIGDLDGDGDLDVATGNGHEGYAILVNAGDGTYEDLRNFLFAAPGYSIVVEDFDRDNAPDVAFSNAGQEVRVILNRGLDSFGEFATYIAGSVPGQITSGHMNADEHLDLITANEGGSSATIYFNNGDGTFGGRLDLAAGARPLSTAPGDLDGDGDNDLTVSNNLSASLSIFTNRGDGTFEEEVRQMPLPGRPNFVVAADFDKDGNVDLITANEDVNATLLWNTGGGNFLPPVTFPIPDIPFSILPTDLDEDGFLDIVISSELVSTVTTFLNNRNRAFILAGSFLALGGARYSVTGDVDADGDLDLLTSHRENGTISVRLNETVKKVEVPFLERVCTEAEFFEISIPAGQGRFLERDTKFILPAKPESSLQQTVFQNAKLFALHEDFLRETFPEHFPALDASEYIQIVGRRATREYYAGFISRVATDDGFIYTFAIIADSGFDAREVLSVDEVQAAYDTLSESFSPRPLAYQPATEADRRAAEAWVDPPFPVHFSDGRIDLEFEPYTLATGYGRVRLLTLEEFQEQNRSGLFTFQDGLVVEDTPADIEGVVGFFVSGRPQGPLSHVAIRTARRGTPNCFVSGAREAFAPFEGKLVRIDVFEDGYVVDDQVTVEEAEAFWAATRPSLDRDPTIDELYATLDHLLEMDVDAAVDPVSRFGGKATNFARLQRVLTGPFESLREPGFGIPIRHYQEFMRSNSRMLDGRELTYEEYLLGLLGSQEIQTDSQRRFEVLDEFRDFARENGMVPDELVANLAQRIEEVFGSHTVMVRFRSSSNVEDQLVFNGAGLYESTSVCAADTLDLEDRDGSFCDPTRDNERTIERALKKVWTSLWTFRAHEERTFYQIDPSLSAMGILCSPAFLDEIANGVAFTGNPRDPRDKRYLITAQLGEESVVSPEPGTTVERDFLELDDSGNVVNIIRNRSSNLVEPGQVVVSDDQLRELGSAMWFIEQNLPLDLEGRQPEDVVLDFEFKVEPDGSVAIKQVRPFLIPSSVPRPPSFELEAPAGTTVCGVFGIERPGREPIVEYETKSQVTFLPQTLELPAASETFAAELFAEVVVGPERLTAVPVETGLFTVTSLPLEGGETQYGFTYGQDFTLPGGEAFRIEVSGLRFRGRGSTPVERTIVLDEEFTTFDLVMQASLDGTATTSYSSCTYSALPLWALDATLEDGSEVHLSSRFLPSPNLLATGPASLIRGEVQLQGTAQVVTDYWRLVYAATRHNRDATYWVLLDSALDLAGLPEPVHAVELVTLGDPELAAPEVRVSYLGADFSVLQQPAVRSFSRRTVEGAGGFQRGDTNVDGTVNLNDVIFFLEFFFRRGPTPSCLKAADSDDNGRLQVTDAVRALQFLFRRGALPEPILCGEDPTEDPVTCEDYPPCG